MIDPITDMLNQIRNAHAVQKTEISVPFSKLKQNIVNILAEEGMVGSVKKGLKKDAKSLKINLKYKDNSPAIMGLRRISKPGQKIYAGYSDMKPVHGGKGFSIISTPKGLMTNRKARQEKVGGEILCEIW
jgi:small subunit ribosomal protein S8